MSDGLLRISEVTELRIDDLEDSTLRIRFSKTDQEGQGEHLYLCEDTRQIVGKWLERSELSEGYLFRRMTARGDNLYRDKNTGEPYALTHDGVRRIIKSCASRVGLVDKVSGHSARIGWLYHWHRLARPLSIFKLRVAGKTQVCLLTTHAPSSPSAAQSHDSKTENDKGSSQ